MAKDPILEGRVRDIAHGGDAVVELEGGIAMVRGGLPGERVRVRLERKRRGVQRGRLLELLERSPQRVEPACALAERCGGCPLMALEPTAQLELKRARVAAAVADPDGSTVEITASPELLGYRGRARLAFTAGKAGLTLGYRLAGSRHPLDVARCPVLAPALQAGLDAVRAHLAKTLAGRGQLHLGTGAGGLAVVHLLTDDTQPAELYQAAAALGDDPRVAGVSLAIAGAAAATFGEPRQRSEGEGGPLWAAPEGFAQANPALNAALVATAVEWAEADDARVLELYAGHGNFSVALAARARELSAVEGDRAAAEACQANLAARGLAERSRVSCEPAETAAARGGEVDVVLLDPPRTGAREAIEGIVARRPRRIVYVSCDPSTLKRDLGALRAAGFRLDRAQAFDMFPHTPHVEAVVRLVR